jgi:hypothetical protein
MTIPVETVGACINGPGIRNDTPETTRKIPLEATVSPFRKKFASNLWFATASMTLVGCGAPMHHSPGTVDPDATPDCAQADNAAKCAPASVRISVVPTPPAVKAAMAHRLNASRPSLRLLTFGEISGVTAIVSGLVNLGVTSFNFLKSNAATVYLDNAPFANAVPKGTTDLTTLDNWSSPKYKTLNFAWNDAIGVTVASTQMTVMWQSNGSYLANVTAYAEDAKAWPFHSLSGDAVFGQPTNAAPAGEPVVAQLVMQYWMTESSVLGGESKKMFSCAFRGDGSDAVCDL